MNAEPFVHRIIQASAGSGKTHQLTNRYLALLAKDVEPDAILATTFTRKAAGEILDRVLHRLAKGAGSAAGAKELAAQIGLEQWGKDRFTKLLHAVLHDLHRVRAGIGTLDSFYIALAGNFSLEIGLPAGWSIGEETDDQAMRDDALERLLEEQPDAMMALFSPLCKGEVKRSVREEMQEVIGEHYEAYRGSLRAAWKSLHVPNSVADAVCKSAIQRLRVYDLSKCGHKGIPQARDKDVVRFEQKDWAAFLENGLAAKVLAEEDTYQRKPIPPEVVAFYKPLVVHARAEALQRISNQTRATWELLDCFHKELWALKQSSGLLRFGEVTQALVDALARNALQLDTFAFRLDSAVEHLLLDEFQDTSLPQWRVLEPMALAITKAKAELNRSFFCVGDVKQAIFAWRGGMAEILKALPELLGTADPEKLTVSHRSAQPVIDVVNTVFRNLEHVEDVDKCRAGIEAWSERFEKHTTTKREAKGYVCLETGPAQDEGEKVVGQRGKHCEFVAKRINELIQHIPGRSIGVLCRRNETVARMIFEFRQKNVEASEEGGNPLTDSPAVEVVLSLFTLADHPGHSVAWFHLKNSPLKADLDAFASADTFASQLRKEVLALGYGPFTQRWAEKLAPACARRDLSRLQQLVEMAFTFQTRSTLRADDFVAWVRAQRVPDPSGANVRVMTIHAAKGLQFDVVILPELDSTLMGQSPAFVVDRDPKTLDVTFICRYAGEATQNLLTDGERCAFELDRQQRVEESLSLLYVAMTRAVHALHLFIPGRRTRRKDAWYNLLWQTLPLTATREEWPQCEVLYEHGDANWFSSLKTAPQQPCTPTRRASEGPALTETDSRQPIVFRARETARRRGLERVAPSSREGQAKVVLDRLFHPSEGTGTAAAARRTSSEGIPSSSQPMVANQAW
jgi:ATP-dependent exoDNAse (exonuclease V) beta subunit